MKAKPELITSMTMMMRRRYYADTELCIVFVTDWGTLSLSLFSSVLCPFYGRCGVYITHTHTPICYPYFFLHFPSPPPKVFIEDVFFCQEEK